MTFVRVKRRADKVGASRVDIFERTVARLLSLVPFCWRFTVVKLTLRDKESIQDAVHRFRKLVERSGLKKEMRRREFYEKPSETKRRARLRAERRAFRAAKMAAR